MSWRACLNTARIPSMADEVTTDLIVMFFRTIGSRRYGFTAESFVLIVKLYQGEAAMTHGLASWSVQSFVPLRPFPRSHSSAGAHGQSHAFRRLVPNRVPNPGTQKDSGGSKSSAFPQVTDSPDPFGGFESHPLRQVMLPSS